MRKRGYLARSCKLRTQLSISYPCFVFPFIFIFIFISLFWIIQAVYGVSPALHSPLMAVTNAISGMHILYTVILILHVYHTILQTSDTLIIVMFSFSQSHFLHFSSFFHSLFLTSFLSFHFFLTLFLIVLLSYLIYWLIDLLIYIFRSFCHFIGATAIGGMALLKPGNLVPAVSTYPSYNLYILKTL